MRSLNKRTKEALERTLGGFEELLGRPAAEQDRIFYWTYTDSAKEMKDEMIRTMISAETPEHLIYIYDKTGFIVSKEGWKKLSKQEKIEIELAQEQYDEESENGTVKLYDSDDYATFSISTDTDFIMNLYILGNFIDRNINSGLVSLGVKAIPACFSGSSSF